MCKLSVIIPVYNTEKYLPECIDSVLCQTYQDYEIILIDDGSSDGSAALCDSYAEDNPCVRVIHQTNAGASCARNSGIIAAVGEYIHFIDSDDRLPDNDVYERFSGLLDGNNEIIFSRRIRFNDGENEINAIQPKYEIDGYYDKDILNHVLLKKYGLTLTCPVNKIFKRSLLIDNDLYFKEGLDHEEDEWIPRVISCARKAWFDDGILYKVRVRKGSLSETKSEENRASKARSKVIIAASGMEYMENKHLSDSTMSLIAEYYWDYMIDACVAYNKIQSFQMKKAVLCTIRDNKEFFKSKTYLASRNKRILGLLFRVFGIKVTIRIIGLRYKT